MIQTVQLTVEFKEFFIKTCINGKSPSDVIKEWKQKLRQDKLEQLCQ
jgi:hypothetical protein